MPTLDWIGKDKVVNHHLDVPFRVLDRKYSFDGVHGQQTEDNGSENMIIHGDNLEALKALLPKYEGKIDCIFIDPPYNTAHSTSDNQRWVYSDNVDDPHIKAWLNKVVGDEGIDFSRHDKWLCMMYPRLKLLQRLLSKNGVIFISLDDNEIHNLKHICDEIFGSNCFVARITWNNNYSLRNDANGIPYETDNICIYSKSPNWSPNRLPRTEEMNQRYVNYDNDLRQYKVTPIHATGASSHKNMVYAIQHPITGELMYPPRGRHWKDSQEKLLEYLNQWAPYELKVIDDIRIRESICGNAVDPNTPAIMLSCNLEEAATRARERYNNKPWPKYFFLAKGLGSLQSKTYLDPSKGKVVSTLWRHEDVGTNVEATNELKKILSGSSLFDNPKPVRLLDRVIQIATGKNSIILDSFAGSGTTAHAVLKRNNEDGGTRKFILVELMDYADSITAERVKRVISGYGEEKKTVEGTGGSFCFYELGPSLMVGDYLNEEVGIERIREYIYYTETKTSLSESNPNEPSYMGTHAHTAYYFNYTPDAATTLNHDFLETIRTKADSYVIYADRCTLSKAELERFRIIFKKIPRDITRF